MNLNTTTMEKRKVLIKKEKKCIDCREKEKCIEYERKNKRKCISKKQNILNLSINVSYATIATTTTIRIDNIDDK